VTFYTVQSELKYHSSAADAASGTNTQTLTVTHQVAMIDEQYKTQTYFDSYESVLSLAPYTVTVTGDAKDTELEKQFLYSLVNSVPGATFSESYALYAP
jgi:hypothetical protein